MSEKIPSVRESLESLTSKKKPKVAAGDPQRQFFVVCEKCGGMIFEHNGHIEAKGLYTFAVECPYCGNGFNHKMMTAKARIREMQKQITDMLNPEMLKNLTKKLLGAGE